MRTTQSSRLVELRLQGVWVWKALVAALAVCAACTEPPAKPPPELPTAAVTAVSAVVAAEGEPRTATPAERQEAWSDRQEIDQLEGYWHGLVAHGDVADGTFDYETGPGFVFDTPLGPIGLYIAPGSSSDDDSQIVRMRWSGGHAAWIEYWAPVSPDPVFTLVFATPDGPFSTSFADFVVAQTSMAASLALGSPRAAIAGTCESDVEGACHDLARVVGAGNIFTCVARSMPTLIRMFGLEATEVCAELLEGAPACVAALLIGAGAAVCTAAKGTTNDVFEFACKNAVGCALNRIESSCPCISFDENCKDVCEEIVDKGFCELVSSRKRKGFKSTIVQYGCRLLGASGRTGPFSGTTGETCAGLIDDICEQAASAASGPLCGCVFNLAQGRPVDVCVSCGDNTCAGGETPDNCPRDCGEGGKVASGYGWGDPHLSTRDGTLYDFQYVGEFLAVDGGSGLTIEVRLAPYQRSRIIATIVAVAADVSGDVVEIDLDPTRLLIGGAAQTVTGPFALPHGGTLAPTGITWPDGTELVVAHRGDHLDVHLFAPIATSFRGLFGDGNGNAADDFKLRDGTVLTKPLAAPDQRAYAASWRIAPTESLFHYDDGKDTTSYTDLSFPDGPALVTALPPAVYESARAICVDAGVTAPAVLDACILDVGMTGNTSYAAGAADADPPVTGPAAIHDVAVDPLSLHVDKLSQHSIVADGSPDGVFTVTVEGPIVALSLVSTNAQGMPAGGSFWDTSPNDATWMLGVEEDGAFINRADSSIPRLAEGLHHLRLYATTNTYFGRDHAVRLVATLPDLTTILSPVLGSTEAVPDGGIPDSRCLPASNAPPLDPAAAGIPTDGLVLWLRSDAGISVLPSGKVCAWNNQAGDEVFFPGAQFLSANYAAPDLINDWIPGIPAVRSASGQCMSTPSVLGIAPASGRTFFAVTEVIDAGLRVEPLLQGLPTSDRLYVGLDRNTFNTAGRHYGVYVSGAAFDANSATTAGRRAVESLVVDNLLPGGQNAAVVHYFNDSAANTLTYRGNVTTVLDSSAMNTTYVACGITGAALQPEAILYSRALDDTERAQVEQYLGRRYSVELQ